MSLLSEVLSLQATKEAILESCAILVADLETGQIYFSTGVAERLFGYLVRGELKGMNVDDLVPTVSRPNHPDNRAAYAKDQSIRTMGRGKPLLGLRKDGTTIPVAIALNAAIIDEKRCVIVSITDISPIV